MKITVPESPTETRLDKFLAEELSDYTRSQIKKLVVSGNIQIDGKAATAHQTVKPGQVIEIDPVLPEKKAEAETKAPEPTIIFEDKNYIILDKPAGLLVHPTEKGEKNTLASWLRAHHPAIEKVGEESYRGGIIHRLDKDVSGVMVAAKTAKAFTALKNEFKNRRVDKHYTALAYGEAEQTGEIELPIGRSKDGKFVAHPRTGKEMLQDKDKIAKTQYRVLEYIKRYSLLDVKILTGRTHQIRAHLTAIGHPIVGDQLYGPKKSMLNLFSKRIKVLQPGRIFLHSTSLGFTDLNGEAREYISPLPQELTTFIDELKH